VFGVLFDRFCPRRSHPIVKRRSVCKHGNFQMTLMGRVALSKMQTTETYTRPDRSSTQQTVDRSDSQAPERDNSSWRQLFLPWHFSAGDYNRNGTVDVNDYTEWKAAFGGSSQAFLYAGRQQQSTGGRGPTTPSGETTWATILQQRPE